MILSAQSEAELREFICMDSEKFEGNVIAAGGALVLVSLVMCFTASAFATVIASSIGMIFCLISYTFFGKHTRELLRIYLAVLLIIAFITFPKI